MLHSLIFGHSLCDHLENYVWSGTHARHSPSFSLQATTSVSIHGISGLTVQRAAANNFGLALRTVRSHAPDIVFLQLGGNDIDNFTNAGSLAQQLISLASALHNRGGVQQVVIGAIMPRFFPDAASLRRLLSRRRRGRAIFRSRRDVEAYLNNYNLTAQATNRALAAGVAQLPFVSFWSHNNSFRFPSPASPQADATARQRFTGDGVHLSPQGNWHFYKSIRGALIVAS